MRLSIPVLAGLKNPSLDKALVSSGHESLSALTHRSSGCRIRGHGLNFVGARTF